MKCRSCSRALKADERFCQSCGAPVPPRRNTFGLILLGVFGLAAILMVVALVLPGRGDDDAPSRSARTASTPTAIVTGIRPPAFRDLPAACQAVVADESWADAKGWAGTSCSQRFTLYEARAYYAAYSDPDYLRQAGR